MSSGQKAWQDGLADCARGDHKRNVVNNKCWVCNTDLDNWENEGGAIKHTLKIPTNYEEEVQAYRRGELAGPPAYEKDPNMKHVDPNGIGQHSAGAKLDAGKIDITLLQEFAYALHEVCRVGDYGQNKYTRGGFLSVPNGRQRYTRAMLDHWFKEHTEGVYDTDPWYDTPEGQAWKGKVRHDAQVAWNALARLEITLREEQNDKEIPPYSVSYSNNLDDGLPVLS